MFEWFKKRHTKQQLQAGSLEAMASQYLNTVMGFRPAYYAKDLHSNRVAAGYVLGVIDAYAQMRGHGFIDDPSQVAPYVASYIFLFGEDEGAKLFLDAVTFSKNADPRFDAGMSVGGEDVHKLLEEGARHASRFMRTLDA